MAVSIDDICARVESERQQARIDALLATLRAIADHYEDDAHLIPDESYWPDDIRALSDYEHWDAAFDEGKRRGEWEIGKIADKAIEDWEASA